MSKSKISFIKRLAIWRAYGKRCVYTATPIEFHELHIDHLIPEYLIGKPHQLKTLLDKLGLPENFDLNSPKNLIPCRSNINQSKGGRCLSEGTLRYFLDLSDSMHEQVLREEELIQLTIRKDDIMLPIGAAIEEGILSQQDAIRYLQRVGNNEILLTATLDFEGLAVSGMVQPNYAVTLMDAHVLHGNHEHDPGLTLVNNDGISLVVRNCNEFKKAKLNGYYASTTYGMKMESFYNRTCGILNALSNAKYPEKSFIDSPRIGVHDIHVLPVIFLPAMSTDDLEELEIENGLGATVKDFVEKGSAKIIDVSQHSIDLEYKHMTIRLTELFRADIDGDGIEDILIFSYSNAIGGTFGYGNVRLISRLSEDSHFVERDFA